MAFERRHEKLASTATFFRRILVFIGISLLIVFGSLTFGAWGYERYVGLTWIDAFHAAAMILFSEGPVVSMPTTAAKTWEIFYSAFSGVAFLSVIGTIWAPIIHRLYHRFHIEDDKQS
ncbi:MAG: hypothetical protein V1907_00120 [Candidatus Kerfeldbacteria bacterium]